MKSFACFNSSIRRQKNVRGRKKYIRFEGFEFELTKNVYFANKDIKKHDITRLIFVDAMDQNYAEGKRHFERN